MKLSKERFFRDEVRFRIDTGNVKTFERFTYETTGKGAKIYDVVLKEPALGTKVYFVNQQKVYVAEDVHKEIEKHFNI